MLYVGLLGLAFIKLVLLACKTVQIFQKVGIKLSFILVGEASGIHTMVDSIESAVFLCELAVSWMFTIKILQIVLLKKNLIIQQHFDWVII